MIRFDYMRCKWDDEIGMFSDDGDDIRDVSVMIMINMFIRFDSTISGA